MEESGVGWGMSSDVVHNGDGFRFEVTVDGRTGVAEYVDRGGVWVMNHTSVPDELRGQGVAGRLVKTALEAARAAGVKVDPQCSYVAVYMERHPEFADLRV